jgi:hypothetical protein
MIKQKKRRETYYRLLLTILHLMLLDFVALFVCFLSMIILFFLSIISHSFVFFLLILTKQLVKLKDQKIEVNCEM